jgi:hypothetical protein
MTGVADQWAGSEEGVVDLREDLEARIRERGVRVEERLALLRALVSEQNGAADIARRREALLEAVRAATRRVRESLP